MSINGKYTVDERRITRHIANIQYMQQQLRQRWLELDVKITALKHQLNNKYEEKPYNRAEAKKRRTKAVVEGAPL